MADIAMTGEAGANRTFRSIFGDQKQQHNDVLKLEQSDCNASVASGAGAAVLAMDDDDDDEAMWSDEPPLNGDATTKDNNDLPGLQFAMSMERLVGNAQRLHFLEDFYQNHQGSGTTPAVAPSSPSSPIS
ncbi:Pyruvate kinase [Phytophthora nicotianae]|uniref:Pyruvate kinase n=1 Tax=Phytophthora nicotianae TaxID=4792 RepID=A0A0W8DTA8_PHYNI|nr:Pyruvate kinase [Phytophthora nicotianae]